MPGIFGQDLYLSAKVELRVFAMEQALSRSQQSKFRSEYGGLIQPQQSSGFQPRFQPQQSSGTCLDFNRSLRKQSLNLKQQQQQQQAPAEHAASWAIYRVISGDLGAVRSVVFHPENELFITGSADKTIKIWETATGKLRLTLTGHIGQVRGLAMNSDGRFLFSAGDDGQIKCWDLQQNKAIRHYHGHHGGVYCLSLHPTLDVLFTGGRDGKCRVWDVRRQDEICSLLGHSDTVFSVVSRAVDPQVITGSKEIKLWDLGARKCMSTLTHHKKSVRALALHPQQAVFASASADNVKKFMLPEGRFLGNMEPQQQGTIVNCMALNEEDVLVTGGDDGSISFWDWTTGRSFQQARTIPQPGSLAGEAGIYAASFDVTGTRLVTCEADKTVKMWKQVP